jgi:pimeloyl-ACP methyl ester carboxylesterase
MLSTVVAVTLLLAGASVLAAPVDATESEAAIFADYLNGEVTGLNNPIVQTSIGGQAICISGTIDVGASAQNLKLTFPEPANSTELTEVIVEVAQPNSTFGERNIQGKTEVSGTFSIFSELCFPRTATTINSTTIHFLIHGGGFDSRYWSPAPGYSYVDTAAANGYATFNYDRLGTGQSEIVDPIATSQKALHIAIAHALVQKLRNGALLNLTFTNIIGVGHSFGSNQLYTLTSKYPSDFDAAILTGYAVESVGQSIAVAGLNAGIANQVDPVRFRKWPNAYVVASNVVGNQFFFLRWPSFSAALADVADAIKQPTSLGEVLGLGDPVVATNFTGPVAVVNGMNDMPICAGDCLNPKNSAEDLVEVAYPMRAAGSDWYIVPGSGHGINFQYGAEKAYEWIIEFVKNHGF